METENFGDWKEKRGYFSKFSPTSGMTDPNLATDGNPKNNENERPVRRTRKINAFLATACEMGGPCSECSLAVFCFGEGGAIKREDLAPEVIKAGLKADGSDLIDTLQNDVEHNLVDTKEKIDAAFDDFVTVLNERRRELLQQVEYGREKKLNILRAERRKRTIPSYVIESDIEEGHAFLPLSRSYTTDLNGSNIQGGTLRFSYDKSFIDSLKSIGNIDNNKASALHSKAEGLGLNFAFTNEESQFEVVTIDQRLCESFVEGDEVRIEIEDPEDQNAKIETIVQQVLEAKHRVTYTPIHPGIHKIHTLVNNLEILGSPFTVKVFDKEKMTFDPEIYLTSAGLSESEDAYIVKKGETEAILTEKGSPGAIIFGAKPFSTGNHAWKVKFTSACPSLHTSVGVSTRSNVFDVDIEHTCDFEINNPTYRSPCQRQLTRKLTRRLSSFRRTSCTYMVILDSEVKLLTILCFDSNVSKTVKLPANCDTLYPCVYMSHDCNRRGHCPRPIVAFV